MRLVEIVKNDCSGIVYVSIVDAVEGHGCPICRLLVRAEEELMKSILYEQVNDPHTRERIRESLGFCPYHTWMISDIISRELGIDGLGASIIYLDILFTYMNNMNNLTRSTLRDYNNKCIICEYLGEFEDIYLSEFVKCLSNGGLLGKYRKSEAVLYHKRFSLIYGSIDDEELRTKLYAIQIGKIRKIIMELQEYIRKQDYRVTEEVSPNEARAWRKAIEIIKGARTSANILENTPAVKKNNRHILTSLLGKNFHDTSLIISYNYIEHIWPLTD